MKLLDAYAHPAAVDVLWRLLVEREPYQSISHKKMPTLAEHKAFIASKPYPQWYLIDCGDIVGATYLTDRREVGISILRKHRGNAYGRNAVLKLRELHPGPLYANINPANRSSINMFVDLGFSHIQVTYACT
jgi:RimJ/RimL family protein N-acetyltransferase